MHRSVISILLTVIVSYWLQNQFSHGFVFGRQDDCLESWIQPRRQAYRHSILGQPYKGLFLLFTLLINLIIFWSLLVMECVTETNTSHVPRPPCICLRSFFLTKWPLSYLMLWPRCSSRLVASRRFFKDIDRKFLRHRNYFQSGWTTYHMFRSRRRT